MAQFKIVIQHSAWMRNQTIRNCKKLLEQELSSRGLQHSTWNARVLSSRPKGGSGPLFKAIAIDREICPGKALIRVVVKLKDGSWSLLLEPPQTYTAEAALKQLQGKDAPDPITAGQVREINPKKSERPTERLVLRRNYNGIIQEVKHYGLCISHNGSCDITHLCPISEISSRSLTEKGLSKGKIVDRLRKAGFSEGSQVRFKVLSEKRENEWEVSIKAATDSPGEGLYSFLNNITEDGELIVVGWQSDPKRIQILAEIAVLLQYEHAHSGYIPKEAFVNGMREGIAEKFKKLGRTVKKISSPGTITKILLGNDLIDKFYIDDEHVGYTPTDDAYREAGLEPLNVDMFIAEQFYKKKQQLDEIEKLFDEQGVLSLVIERDEIKDWIAQNPKAKSQYEQALNKIKPVPATSESCAK